MDDQEIELIGHIVHILAVTITVIAASIAVIISLGWL